MILVGCGKAKLGRPAQAQDLYTGGLFRMCRMFALRSRGPWWILSARHGLVEPTRILAPYDETLVGMHPTQRDTWGRMVAKQIQALGRPLNEEIVLLAGSAYAAFVPHIGRTVKQPMEGLGIGHRLAWLKGEIGR